MFTLKGVDRLICVYCTIQTGQVVESAGDIWHLHASFHRHEQRAEHGDESQHVELMSSGRLVGETVSQSSALYPQSRLESLEVVRRVGQYVAHCAHHLPLTVDDQHVPVLRHRLLHTTPHPSALLNTEQRTLRPRCCHLGVTLSTCHFLVAICAETFKHDVIIFNKPTAAYRPKLQEVVPSVGAFQRYSYEPSPRLPQPGGDFKKPQVMCKYDVIYKPEIRIVSLRHQDRTTAMGNTHKKLIKIGRVVAKTHTHAHTHTHRDRNAARSTPLAYHAE